MTTQGKKTFLILSITIPFLLYCFYYYGMMIKNAPYKFAEFQYIEFQFGPADSLVNRYNSKTGDYQYANKRDSVIKKKMNLTRDELLYLHRKAADLGFWDFPVNEKGDTTSTVHGEKPLRYVMTFSYQRKTKKVIYDIDYDGNEKLKDANERLIKEIQKVLQEAEDRNKIK